MPDTREDEAQVPAGLDHGHGGRDHEAEVVLDLMRRLDIACGNLGSHSHAGAPQHHHHDLRCLVEAGANTVRPALKSAQTSRDTWHRMADAYERQRDEARQQLDHVGRTSTARLAEITSMETFMQTMPAVGPWKHIWEQYQAWVEERREEEAANG